MKYVALLALLVSLALVACSAAPCEDQVTAFADSAKGIMTQLDDFSSSHSPVEVAAQVQTLKRETEDLKVPTCGDAPLDVVAQDVADGLTATLNAAFDLAMKSDEVGIDSISPDLIALRQLYLSARAKYDEDFQTLFVALAYDK